MSIKFFRFGMNILKPDVPVGLACDHAGYEFLKWEFRIRISGRIRPRVASILILALLWLLLLRVANAIPVLRYAGAAMV